MKIQIRKLYDTRPEYKLYEFVPAHFDRGVFYIATPQGVFRINLLHLPK